MRSPLAVIALAALFASGVHAATLAPVTSANLTYHIDASQMISHGGDGTTITDWKELTTGVSVNIQSTPTYIASSVINGMPVVRFDGGPSGSDLIFSNNAAIFNTSAQTIIGVTTMTSDGFDYSDLVSNSAGSINVRQGLDGSAAYFTGNGGDFHFGGGSFAVNGVPTFTVDGGFGAGHVVRSVSPTVKNINSLRIGDNANNRVWSGDVAELLVFDGVLSGNDTAQVNKYLIDKYAIPIVVDEDVTASSQVATRPFGDDSVRLAGVNLYFAGGSIVSKAETFGGVGFDNVLAGNPKSITGMDLYGNTPGVTLDLTLGGTQSNTSRVLSPGITGDGAGVLNAIANGNHYISSGPDSDTSIITFNGLHANQEVFVQLLGGQHGWTGVPDVIVNGGTVGQWTTNTGPSTQMSMFGFFATADGSGTVEIDLQVNSGDFAGIAGVVLHSNQRAADTTVDDAITQSEQVYNNVFGEKTVVLAAINFHNNAGSNGILGATTVHGVAFDDVYIGQSGGANYTNLALTENLSTATLTTNFSQFLDRQDSTTVAGQDAGAVNTLLRDIHSIGVGETHEFTVGGLWENREVFVQLFGGDAGWSADLDVYVNGGLIDRWTTAADVNGGTAGSFGFYTMTDGLGRLVFDIDAVNVGGGGNANYAGISGLLITTVAPAPGALPAGLAMLGLIAARRRR